MTDTAHRWPAHLDAGAVRFARPTARYDEVLTFYRDALGLPVLAQWRGHAGYDGMVLGLPGTPVHLELTRHGDPPRIPEPHPENQLVLYLRGPEAVETAVRVLAAHGHRPEPAANPYWPERGAVVFADPDGWRVVLAPWVFGEQDPPAVRHTAA
ncbi:VOC family protein [Streptomyces sp. JJ36]|uniref:VOC family protein n=1 Tax=Streptomyces sp. JJ36 TaxID=2736645 RepID=UPI001F44B2EC|nr:VOC family protein [Streptomyces sp. JJ36]MCF6525908.1 VOC family protein [Streptomyces sp. JJ36]